MLSQLKLPTLLTSLLTFVIAAAATKQHQNPPPSTIPGLYADPNIAIFNCTYYIYATTDGYANWGGTDFYVWKSPDLVSWTRGTEPFLTLDGGNGTGSGSVPWSDGNAWAPTIIERGGKYYFYFSGNEPASGEKMIGVAVSSEGPEGPFVAADEPMIRNDERLSTGQAIDPATFYDPVSGKYYLFWGNGEPALFAELNEDMVSVDWGSVAEIKGLVDFTEGGFVNYRRGLYHLTYSVGDTGDVGYHVRYATATNVEEGGWTYRGVLLEKDAEVGVLGTGHDSVVNVPGTDVWVIAYHRFRVPGGDGNHREVVVQRVGFDKGTGFMEVVKPGFGGIGEGVVIPGC